jgi:hypothetical protein
MVCAQPLHALHTCCSVDTNMSGMPDGHACLMDDVSLASATGGCYVLCGPLQVVQVVALRPKQGCCLATVYRVNRCVAAEPVLVVAKRAKLVADPHGCPAHVQGCRTFQRQSPSCLGMRSPTTRPRSTCPLRCGRPPFYMCHA